MSNFRIIIPTYNAERHLADFIPALREQKISPSDVLVVDSSSKDRTVQIFKDYGAVIEVIDQARFNHGATRRMAAERSRGYTFLIYMTQDAIPRSGAFEMLMNVFEREPTVGLAYGRQLPRPTAKAIERHARLFNYPPASSQRTYEDRAQLGVKTTFCSNSFAGYRYSHLQAVGGFPEESFFGEDQIVSGRMLLAGYKIAYAADAQVTHSHGYSVLDDFKRYFDVGVFHRRNEWLLERFGKAEGEGLKFILSEMRYLASNEPSAIPSALVRTILKYVGYRLGFVESKLSNSFKRKVSMSPYYWREAARP